VEKMLDYVTNTPEDPLRSYACVEQRRSLIERNLELLGKTDDPVLKKLLAGG
jgi:4-O-beta-D-mannosyl-D-glucose phosphorylase